MKCMPRPLDGYEIFTAACFLLGGLAGVVAANCADEAALLTSISGYLDGFSVGYSSVYLFFTNFLTQLRYPLILFVFGFTVFGCLVIPSAIAVKGYALAFAFTSFFRVMGTNAYFVIPVLFGLQSLVTLPCLFLLAISGMRIGFILLRVHFLHIRGTQAVSGIPNLHGFITCFAVTAFMASVVALFDSFVTPQLISFLNL